MNVVVIWKTGCDDAVLEGGGRGHGHRRPVERGTSTAFRREELVAEGIVDHTHCASVIVVQRDGHGHLWDRVDEIDGSVEGIDDPLPTCAASSSGFLRQNEVVGSVLGDHTDYRGLGSLVDRRDRIELALVFGGVSVPESLGDDCATSVSCCDGDFEIVHDGDGRRPRLSRFVSGTQFRAPVLS